MNGEKFLLDTTIWVKYLRGLDDSLKDRVASLVLEDRVFITEVIILELLRGAKTDREYTSLSEDLLALPRLAVSDAVWKAAWRLSYTLRKKGANIPLADTVIAAVSIHYACTLLHSDGHYPLVAKHAGLKEVAL